jgi:hypothetical protein
MIPKVAKPKGIWIQQNQRTICQLPPTGRTGHIGDSRLLLVSPSDLVLANSSGTARPSPDFQFHPAFTQQLQQNTSGGSGSHDLCGGRTKLLCSQRIELRAEIY